MVRVSQAGQEILVAFPSTGIARVSLAGSEVLADAPPSDTRVSALMVEVLVSGEAIPPGRVSQVGSEVLLSTPYQDTRVSAVMAEVLVSGEPIPAGRVSQVGSEVLAGVPFEDTRVSALMYEVLVATDYSMMPGKLHALGFTATLPAAYADVDAAYSELTVNALSLQAAAQTLYETDGSLGRFTQITTQITMPSAILEWEPAARVYLQYAEVALPSLPLPTPDQPQSDLFASYLAESAAATAAFDPAGSDLFASYLSESAAATATFDPAGSDLFASALAQGVGLGAGYPSKSLVQSLGNLYGTWAEVTSPALGLPDPALPQSDLIVSYADQRNAAETGYLPKDETQSTVTLNTLSQQSGVQASYLDKDAAQSGVDVSAIVAMSGVQASYPDRYPVTARVAGTSAAVTVAAGWLDDYVTQLRAHSADIAVSLPAPEGVYIEPALVRPRVEVSYLTHCTATKPTTPFGGGSAVAVSYVSQQTAARGNYPRPDSPESVVTVSWLGAEVVYSDDSFGDFTPDPFAGQPFSSISLIFNDE